MPIVRISTSFLPVSAGEAGAVQTRSLRAAPGENPFRLVLPELDRIYALEDQEKMRADLQNAYRACDLARTKKLVLWFVGAAFVLIQAAQFAYTVNHH